MPHAEKFAGTLAEAIGEQGWTLIRTAWKLPQVLATSTWADAIVRHANLEDLNQLVRFVVFLDAGEETASPAPLRPGHFALIKALVKVGQVRPAQRLEIAGLLRRRVGDVFGVVEAARWTRLEDERRIVRTWIADEVLDVLFKHLVPVGMGSHQTDPRRRFWSRYTSRVQRLWLLLDHRLKRRLDRPEIRELLDKVGDMVEIRDLQGGEEQAVMWMHVRSDQGRILTIIEGNANTTCRVRDGELHPPRGAVHYSSHIVHGGRDVISQQHHPHWESRLAESLRNWGIRP